MSRKPSATGTPPPGSGRGATDPGSPPSAPARGKRKRALAESLEQELRALRAELHEALERYTARVDGNLAGILARLHGNAAAGDAPLIPPARASREMLRWLRDRDLKPEKGRPRDLAEFHRLAKKLAKALED